FEIVAIFAAELDQVASSLQGQRVGQMDRSRLPDHRYIGIVADRLITRQREKRKAAQSRAQSGALNSKLLKNIAVAISRNHFAMQAVIPNTDFIDCTIRHDMRQTESEVLAAVEDVIAESGKVRSCVRIRSVSRVVK